MYQFDPVELSLLERSCVPQAVYQFVDNRVVTLALSAGFCELFGFSDKREAYDVMNNNMYRDAHPDDAGRIADAAYRFATEGGEYEVIYRTKAPSESGYRIIHARGRHFQTPTGERLASVWYSDEGLYTEDSDPQNPLSRLFNKVLRAESRMQTNLYDALTGLPNMTGFFEMAGAARGRMVEAGLRPAVLYLDLIGMKTYNQKFGFSEGDKLIRAFGRLLANRFGNENAARFGQDHFAVLTDAAQLREKLEALFAACLSLNEGRSAPVRVGVYLDEEANVDIDAACDRAKTAADSLSTVLSSGFCYFDRRMQAKAEQRQYILDNFDRALAEGWIQVYYQPIVRTANGRVCDEEALARWIDPVRGLLSPADFIPILEDARLIYRLDLYVVEQTLKKMCRLRDEGLFVVPASLNLSRSDFACCDIVEEIRRRVDESGVGRDRITIEITESMIGGDFAFMKSQLDRLHALGFPVWMDDFGSEYSSLDYLQSLHFDLLKFDMRFMQQFDQSERSRIILTELVKMAIGLGIDTIAEGVETKEQVDFLTEIGCTKLQGFYFCRPIPLEDILARYRNGVQIGFENPAEEDYYAAIGRINLYDLAVLAHEDEASLQHFFNTLPMAIIESTGDDFMVSRCNQSYRAFLTRVYGFAPVGEHVPYSRGEGYTGNGFLRALRQCGLDGTRTIVDEELSDGGTVHAFIKPIAVNPVTGTTALAVAVLAVLDPKERAAGLNYADIAQALSADYYNLFYVNLDTEDFIEYRNDPAQGGLALERHGSAFFTASRHDAQELLYPDDVDAFCTAFTKENVLRLIDETGSFTATYRVVMFGEPVYASMKAVRMRTDMRHLIIGVCNVDAQTKQSQTLARIQEEQISYSRIAALADDYLCFYTVDLETNRYREYSATQIFERLGVTKEGEDYFADGRREVYRLAYPDDIPFFLSRFTKEQVLDEIERSGRFVLRYRIMVEGEPVFINLKAARVREKDGEKLIFGVSNVDAIVKRENALLRSLEAAQSCDALTGLNREQKLQLLLDQLTTPSAILSVAREPDGCCGEIRIVRANQPYRALSGPAYYENMLYQDLVPRDLKFEDYCFRSAFEGVKLRTYVKVSGLDFWTDESFLPLEPADESLGYCLFTLQATVNAEPDRLASVSMDNAETVIKSCITLVSAQDFHTGVQSVLTDLRAISEAGGCRILLIDHAKRRITNYCDSVREGETGGLPAGGTLPYELVASWEKLLGTSNAVILRSERDKKQLRLRNPLWAESLADAGIDSLVLLPLYHEKAVLGYLYITNFNVDKVTEIKELVELMAFFLGAELSNRFLLDRLEELSHTDALTGAGNRAAVSKRLPGLSGCSFGILNLDLNGLKTVNDSEGHAAGDRLLLRAAAILRESFPAEDIFRVGGDEFLVISTALSREEFEEKTAALRQSGETGPVRFALGACWSDGSMNPRLAIREADRQMYRSKHAYYERHPELRILR